MYCQNCGKSNQDAANFCVYCGKSLTGNKVGGPIKLSKDPITKNPIPQTDTILGYKYTIGNEFTLATITEAFEKKGDLTKKLGTTNYIKYTNSKGNKSIVIYTKDGYIYVFGNELGLSSAKTRYFKKTKFKQQRINRSEVGDKEVASIISTFPNKKGGFLDSKYLDWRIEKSTLELQIGQYNILGWFAARRKQASMLILASLALTGIITPFHILNIDLSSFILSLVVYLPLATFMFFGKRWAFIVGMVLWTFEKGYSFYLATQTGSATIATYLIIFIWWSMYMRIFWQSFKIEQVRRRVE